MNAAGAEDEDRPDHLPLLGQDRAQEAALFERHAAILPQELDQLKGWYADAHAQRKLPLVPLQNLLDNLERRLKT